MPYRVYQFFLFGWQCEYNRIKSPESNERMKGIGYQHFLGYIKCNLLSFWDAGKRCLRLLDSYHRKQVKMLNLFHLIGFVPFEVWYFNRDVYSPIFKTFFLLEIYRACFKQGGYFLSFLIS